MDILSKKIKNLPESETFAMSRKSRELSEKGFDVINLSIGEPDFNTPNKIKKAAITAIDDNYSHYTPVSGYPDLRKAISEKFKRDNNLDYSPDQIVVSTGAKQSIANVLLTILEKGDEIIVPTPYWVSYKGLTTLSEATPIFIEAKIENDFKITPEQVESAITNKTKLFIFSSPCNPSGSVYSKKELKAIADVFANNSVNKNVHILSDEIYEHINFIGKHESIGQFEGIKNRVITVNGVSKGFAMTGWRLGYMGAPKFIALACDKFQGQITSAASSISQRAAIEAVLTNTSELKEMATMLKTFLKRRDLVLQLLADIPGVIANVPDGAFYVFPNISSYFGKSDGNTVINSSKDICMYLLNKAKVALVPGEAFGNKECIRISYATSNELLIIALNRVKNALEQLI